MPDSFHFDTSSAPEELAAWSTKLSISGYATLQCEPPVLSTIGLWSKSGRHRETHCPFSVTVKGHLGSRELSAELTFPVHCRATECPASVEMWDFYLPHHLWPQKRLPYSLRGDLEPTHFKPFLVSVQSQETH